MKTAIYIEDGVVQLVLTPQDDFERNALSSFSQKPLKVEIFDGTFYDCRGGWTRQKDYFDGYGTSVLKSLILRIGKEE